MPFNTCFIDNKDNFAPPYSQNFLQEATCNSQSFLEEVTYKVNLKQLYTMKSSCYYHEGMQYSPVLVQISEQLQHLKIYNGCKFLLQVWDNKNRKVYEKQLRHEVTTWAIHYNYFLFKTEESDDNNDCFQLVNLEKGNSTFLIEDFVKDKEYKHIAYHQNIFYLASSKNIKMYPLVDDIEDGQELRITPDESEIATIQPEDMKIHGIIINQLNDKSYQMLIPLETLDNQIDLNILEVHNSIPDKLSFQFKQYREVFSRKGNLEPIQKLSYAFDKNGDIFLVTLRDSNKVDFYFNGQSVSTYNSPDTIQQVECGFDETYLLNGKTQEVRSVDHGLKSRMCFEESDGRKNFNFSNIFYQRIKNHCKIFNSFVFIKTFILVAHGNIVSLFNVLKQKWMSHIPFSSEVEQTFKMKGDSDQFNFCILLKDGNVKFIVSKKDSKGKYRYFLDDKKDLQIPGKIWDFDIDNDESNWAFVLTQTENSARESRVSYNLNIIYKYHLFTYTDEQLPYLQADTNFVFMFSPNDKSEVLMQRGSNIQLFELSIGEDGQPNIFRIWEMENVPGISENLHSGLRFKDPRYMFLVDNTNFYKIDIITNENRIYENQNCIGLYFQDNNYLYTMCHKSGRLGQPGYKPSGFRLYDIENVIEKDIDNSYLLNSIQVGCQGLITFSNANQRFVFQSSFDRIEVVPVLHKNTILFIGMEPRQAYLATKVQDDKFICLDKENNLITWGILNGKVRVQRNLRDINAKQDYSNYEIFNCSENDIVYQREWYNKILIRCKTPIANYDENTFFDAEAIKSFMKSQVSYIKRSEKRFYEFKLIEIIDEQNVKEHLSFIYPHYEGKQKQGIFFSSDTKLMFEALSNGRYFLYQKMDHPNAQGTNMVKWDQIHRFVQLPDDLLRYTQYPYIFSKDFTMYLDVDRKHKKFMIRDSFTQEIRYNIPEWLMTVEQGEELVEVAHRFMWLDNDTVRIINSEGIEKKVDLKNNFAEIEFNIIRMFKPEWAKRGPYYLDPPSTEAKNVKEAGMIFDTLKRLKRKYQHYKSAYQLEMKQDSHSLLPILNQVDYNYRNSRGKYVSDLSFTFLHWNLMEQLERGDITVEDIDNAQVQRLIYNILPSGDTFLHKFSKKTEVIEAIFNICHPNPQDRSDFKYEVPFIKNFKQMSPMDLLNDLDDYKSMDMMLDYLSGYGLDHHSRAMFNTLPNMIEHSLPNLGKYLDSRLIQTHQVQRIKKGAIKETDPLGICVANYWLDPENRSELLAKAKIEKEIRLEFIDIPSIHQYDNETAEKFMAALAETEDMDLFNKKAIRKIIEYKWPLTRKYTIQKMFVPYVIFMSIYLSYMNYVYYMRDFDDFWRQINLIYIGSLTLFALFFLNNERRQLMSEGWHYLSSIWNYLDIIPPIVLAIFIPLELIGVFDDGNAPTLEATLQATMSLVLWMKFLYFLRNFQSTGYLIRIIVEVMYDMRHFLMILLLTFVAFGDAMRSISTSNNPSDQFIGSYFDAVTFIYRMVLGDFDTENFGVVAVPYVWVLFILCTVFNMIIMLNLLIAIISESFAKINSVSEQASYQEKAGIISENSFLISDYRKRLFCQPNRYLLIVTDVEQEMKEKGDMVEYQIESITSKINQHGDFLQKTLTEKLNQMHDEQKQQFEKTIAKVRKDYKKIKKLITKHQPKH